MSTQKKVTRIDETMNNVIRCAIALSAPEIAATALKYRGGVPEDNRMFPKYMIEGNWNGSSFFTYVDGRFQGKKRIYVNSDGTRIMYVTKKMLRRYRDDVIKDCGLADAMSGVKLLELVSDRWVILKLGPWNNKLPKTWKDMFSLLQQGYVEIKSSKSNHPPTGPRKFGKIGDSMGVSDIVLSEYRLP